MSKKVTLANCANPLQLFHESFVKLVMVPRLKLLAAQHEAHLKRDRWIIETLVAARSARKRSVHNVRMPASEFVISEPGITKWAREGITAPDR